MENIEKRREAIEHLKRLYLELDALHAMGSDVCYGIKLMHDKLSQHVKSSEMGDGVKPENRKIFYGAGPPNNPGSKFHHATTAKQLLGRTAPDGENIKKLYMSIIVYAYMYWEDGIREKFAKSIGHIKNGIKSDVFADLGKYRNAIAHNNGILRKKTLALTFVEVSLPVHLTEQQLKELFSILIEELNNLAKEYCSIETKFQLEHSLVDADL